MKIKSKEGSYIIEAALVLPIMIIALITVILIIMFFYMQVKERCDMHMTLREEAGKLTGTTIYLGDEAYDKADMEMYSDRDIVGGTVHGKKYLTMKEKGLLRKKGTFIVKGSCYAIDGAEYVRYRNIIRGTESE